MFRERIQAVFSELPPSNQKLASFILDNYHQAAFMSTNQIGNLLDLDAATVVRFAQRLEYSGYPELRNDMRKAIERDLHAPSTWPASIPRDATDMKAAVMTSLQIQTESIQALCTSLAQEPLTEALEKLLGAQRIFVIGEGISRRIADLFVYGLRSVGMNSCLLNTDFGDTFVAALAMNPEDVLVGIVCTPLCPRVVGAVRTVKAEGISTMALVGARSWPLARLTDIVLIAPDPQPAIFAHYSTMTALVRAMLDALTARRHNWLLDQAARIKRVTKSLLECEHGIDADAMPEKVSQYLSGDGDEGNAASDEEQRRDP